MTEKEVYTELEYTDHTQQKWSKMAMVILNEPSLIATLLAIVSKVHDPISYRASWILESVIRKDVSYLFPYLYNFTTFLEQNHATGSAAYKARARMTLKKISALK